MSDSIGATLKDARRRLGLRVKDVAARTRARISPSYLSCIENDLRLPSEDLLLELADLLGLDRLELYRRLVRTKAPAELREELDRPDGADPRYADLRSLPFADVVERAWGFAEARRENERLRREVDRLSRVAGALAGGATYRARWEEEAASFRLRVARTVVEAAIGEDGDLVVRRHVIGLEPVPGAPPVLVLQHTARVLFRDGAAEDELKVTEAPPDVSFEIERERVGPETTVLRIVFPDGLAHEPGRVRRLTYSFRSALGTAYSMERDGAPEPLASRASASRADREARSSFVVVVDKPTEELDVEVAFPRAYVPETLSAWAGTQEFHEAEDDLLGPATCESHRLERDRDDRVRLRIARPRLGTRFGIVWRPLTREEHEALAVRLSAAGEEGTT